VTFIGVFLMGYSVTDQLLTTVGHRDNKQLG